MFLKLNFTAFKSEAKLAEAGKISSCLLTLKSMGSANKTLRSYELALLWLILVLSGASSTLSPLVKVRPISLLESSTNLNMYFKFLMQLSITFQFFNIEPRKPDALLNMLRKLREENSKYDFSQF